MARMQEVEAAIDQHDALTGSPHVVADGTEVIGGYDLVVWQRRVAHGSPSKHNCARPLARDGWPDNFAYPLVVEIHIALLFVLVLAIAKRISNGVVCPSRESGLRAKS